jgi:hypothetical protein
LQFDFFTDLEKTAKYILQLGRCAVNGMTVNHSLELFMPAIRAA